MFMTWRLTGKVADRPHKHRQPSVVLSYRHAGCVVLSAAYTNVWH